MVVPVGHGALKVGGDDSRIDLLEQVCLKPYLLLRQPGLGDLYLHADPVPGLTVIIAYQSGLVSDPDDRPILGDHPILHLERLACGVCPLVLG